MVCDLSFEYKATQPVCGIDEAGRGPWAGPVVAAAVVLNTSASELYYDDSKKLSATKRDALFEAIYAQHQVGVGIATVEEIDTLNILAATKLAMQRAYGALDTSPASALIDGNQPPTLPCDTQAIVKGDSKSLSIAAASIIAKVTRDRMMAELAAEHPHYGWERNAGYGTKAHQEGLAAYGITPHHRRSFAPIKRLIAAYEQAAA